MRLRGSEPVEAAIGCRQYEEGDQLPVACRDKQCLSLRCRMHNAFCIPRPAPLPAASKPNQKISKMGLPHLRNGKNYDTISRNLDE